MKELKAYMDQNGYEAFRNINTKGVNIDTVSNHLNQNQFFPFNNFITALSFLSKEDLNSTEKCKHLTSLAVEWKVATTRRIDCDAQSDQSSCMLVQINFFDLKTLRILLKLKLQNRACNFCNAIYS